MTRNIILFIVICITAVGGVLFFVGSGKEEYTSTQGGGSASASEQQVVRTEAGNEFSLTLPMNTEGYTWKPIFNDTYVTLEDVDEGTQETVFTFEAQLQGATDISFVYEPKSGGDPQEEHSVRVEIR